MENEERVRGFVESEEVAQHVKENDLFQGTHRKGKIYIPSEHPIPGAQVGRIGEIAGIPFVLEPVEAPAPPIPRGVTDDIDGIPPALTLDSDEEPHSRALLRSPLAAFHFADESDGGPPALIPLSEGEEADRSPVPSYPPLAMAASAVQYESVSGRSYPEAVAAAQSLLPDGSITPFQLPPPMIPVAYTSPGPRFTLSRHIEVGRVAGSAVRDAAPFALHNPFIVMPPSQIPVPGTEHFIFLGGVVNSRFTGIMSQADVRARIEQFGALVINAYQTEPRSEETPKHEMLRDEVATLQSIHRTSDLADIDYFHVDLQDTLSASINDHVFTTAVLIDAALASNKQVFVYCGKGKSRSATLVQGYLILAKNMTAHAASDHILQQREVIDLNPNFSFALDKLARYNYSIIGSREATVAETAEAIAEEITTKISLAEKIVAIRAILREEQAPGRVEEPASPASPVAVVVPFVLQQPATGRYDECCGGHSFRDIEQLGTNPLSLSLGSASRSWSYRASGSYRGFDPVIDDRRPGDDKPDCCLAHSVSKIQGWLHEPASIERPDETSGVLLPLPGSTEAEEHRRSGPPTA